MTGKRYTDEEMRQIEAQFTESELRYRSDMQSKVDELLRAEAERSKKYDPFIDILLQRELDREELRKAVIRHGTLFALGAVALFAASAAWHEVQALLAMVKR